MAINRKLIILLIFFFILTSIVLANHNSISKALEYYEKGYLAFQSQKYEEAKCAFNESYNFNPHPQTAFLLSCCYYNLDDKENALKYSGIAQTGEPSLEEKYKREARKIEMWAKNLLPKEETINIKAISFKKLNISDVELASKLGAGRLLCVSKKELKGEETVASCLAKGERFAIVDPYGIVRILTPDEVELTKAFNPKAFETRAFGMRYIKQAPAMAPLAAPTMEAP